jgi:hypothetical protein
LNQTLQRVGLLQESHLKNVVFCGEGLQIVGFLYKALFLKQQPNAREQKQNWQSRTNRCSPQQQGAHWQDFWTLSAKALAPLPQQINIQPGARTQNAPQRRDLLNREINQNAMIESMT